MFSSLKHLLLFSILIATATSPVLGKVEAIRGKTYRLSSQHGPWMIMAASMKDVPADRRVEGMTSQEAANELVYELRKKGIPSYTFRMGEETAVLAGNFESNKDELAGRVLKHIKTYVPRFMTDKKNGALFFLGRGKPQPLSGAFLTMNPKADRESIQSRTVDPVVRKLNADQEYSLLKNPGKYTLRIATYTGTSMLQVSGSQGIAQASAKFENTLDQAGHKAWELCEALRMAKKFGYDQNYEAWVYHDRRQSCVCVGSFNSPDDPRLVALARTFQAKTEVKHGKEVLIGSTMSIPRYVQRGKRPEKFWVLDVKPTLMPVPGK